MVTNLINDIACSAVLIADSFVHCVLRLIEARPLINMKIIRDNGTSGPIVKNYPNSRVGVAGFTYLILLQAYQRLVPVCSVGLQPSGRFTP